MVKLEMRMMMEVLKYMVEGEEGGDKRSTDSTLIPLGTTTSVAI